MRRTQRLGTASLLLMLMGVPAVASGEQVDDDLEQEVRALRAEVQALRAEQDDGWLSAQQTEEVQALVDDVLRDADARTAFAAGDGLTAGHDGSFFLESPDGNNRLQIGGQIQFRYNANFRDNPDTGTSTESGFQFRRTRIDFRGRVIDPRLTFRLQTQFSRNGGAGNIANLQFGYQLTDELGLTVGRYKAPFLKEEMHSSGRQLAAERSSINNVFTGARSTGVQLDYSGDTIRAYGMVNDGFGTGLRRFDADDSTARLGLTGRVEAKLAGEWGQYRDFVGWSEDPFGLFVGAAGHWEHNRTNRLGGPFDDTRDFATWTVDAAAYYQNFSAFAAFVGRHDLEVADFADRYSDYGVLVQGAYNINDRIAPFVRYEWLMPDSARTFDDGRSFHDIHLVTAGVNYYLYGHAAKLTTDVVWTPNSLSGFYSGSEGLGLLPDAVDSRNQIAIRAQFQLLF